MKNNCGAIRTNESVPQYLEGEAENMMKGQLFLHRKSCSKFGERSRCCT
jgi:hypothetical protein